MSDNAEHNAERVEQITKAPSNVSKKEKDPKRVAAGKKLAEKNKLMKEDYARLKASEAQRATEALQEAAEPETETGGSEWLSKLSLTNVISLVGIGLAVYNIYMRSKDNQPTKKEHEAWREPVTTTFEEPKLKFGM